MMWAASTGKSHKALGWDSRKAKKAAWQDGWDLSWVVVTIDCRWTTHSTARDAVTWPYLPMSTPIFPTHIHPSYVSRACPTSISQFWARSRWNFICIARFGMTLEQSKLSPSSYVHISMASSFLIKAGIHASFNQEECFSVLAIASNFFLTSSKRVLRAHENLLGTNRRTKWLTRPNERSWRVNSKNFRQKIKDNSGADELAESKNLSHAPAILCWVMRLWRWSRGAISLM